MQSGGNGTAKETPQQEFDRLNREIREEGHDAEYYQSRGRRLNELMRQGALRNIFQLSRAPLKKTRQSKDL